MQKDSECPEAINISVTVEKKKKKSATEKFNLQLSYRNSSLYEILPLVYIKVFKFTKHGFC